MTLATNISGLHKFYSDHSVFSHVLGDDEETVSGADIKAQIEKLYGDVHVDIILENGVLHCQNGMDGT